jgi:hypothetical protein
LLFSGVYVNKGYNLLVFCRYGRFDCWLTWHCCRGNLALLGSCDVKGHQDICVTSKQHGGFVGCADIIRYNVTYWRHRSPLSSSVRPSSSSVHAQVPQSFIHQLINTNQVTLASFHTLIAIMQGTAMVTGRAGGAATALGSHRLNSSRCIAPCARPGWQSASSSNRWRAALESRDMQLAEDITQPSVDFLGVVNDMQTARGFITNAHADPDLVYQILSDYDSCPRVFRSVARSETVETPDGRKQVLQVGAAPVAVSLTAALHSPCTRCAHCHVNLAGRLLA